MDSDSDEDALCFNTDLVVSPVENSMSDSQDIFDAETQPVDLPASVDTDSDDEILFNLQTQPVPVVRNEPNAAPIQPSAERTRLADNGHVDDSDDDYTDDELFGDSKQQASNNKDSIRLPVHMSSSESGEESDRDVFNPTRVSTDTFNASADTQILNKSEEVTPPMRKKRPTLLLTRDTPTLNSPFTVSYKDNNDTHSIVNDSQGSDDEDISGSPEIFNMQTQAVFTMSPSNSGSDLLVSNSPDFYAAETQPAIADNRMLSDDDEEVLAPDSQDVYGAETQAVFNSPTREDEEVLASDSEDVYGVETQAVFNSPTGEDEEVMAPDSQDVYGAETQAVFDSPTSEGVVDDTLSFPPDFYTAQTQAVYQDHTDVSEEKEEVQDGSDDLPLLTALQTATPCKTKEARRTPTVDTSSVNKSAKYSMLDDLLNVSLKASPSTSKTPEKIANATKASKASGFNSTTANASKASKASGLNSTTANASKKKMLKGKNLRKTILTVADPDNDIFSEFTLSRSSRSRKKTQKLLEYESVELKKANSKSAKKARLSDELKSVKGTSVASTPELSKTKKLAAVPFTSIDTNSPVQSHDQPALANVSSHTLIPKPCHVPILTALPQLMKDPGEKATKHNASHDIKDPLLSETLDAAGIGEDIVQADDVRISIATSPEQADLSECENNQLPNESKLSKGEHDKGSSNEDVSTGSSGFSEREVCIDGANFVHSGQEDHTLISNESIPSTANQTENKTNTSVVIETSITETKDRRSKRKCAKVAKNSSNISTSQTRRSKECKTPKTTTSKDNAPNTTTSKDKAPKTTTNKDKAPKTTTSKDKAPKTTANKDKAITTSIISSNIENVPTSSVTNVTLDVAPNNAPKTTTSKDKAPKTTTSKDKVPKTTANKDKAVTTSIIFSNTDNVPTSSRLIESVTNVTLDVAETSTSGTHTQERPKRHPQKRKHLAEISSSTYGDIRQSDGAPKTTTSKAKAPKTTTSKDKAPKTTTSKDKAPKTTANKDKAPKTTANKDKAVTTSIISSNTDNVPTSSRLKESVTNVTLDVAETSTSDTRAQVPPKRHPQKRKHLADISSSTYGDIRQSDSESLSSQSKSVSSSQKVKRGLHHGTKIIFTGISNTLALEKMLPKLGCILVKDVNTCTHLIANEAKRTIKFLCALTRGVNIVTTEWLTQSNKAANLLDTEKYQLKDKRTETLHGFNLQRSLQLARNNAAGVLSNCRVHVTRNTLPPPQEIKELVTAAGGKFCATLPKNPSDKLFVVSCEEDRSLYSRLYRSGYTIVDKEFILCTLLRQEIKPENFLLK